MKFLLLCALVTAGSGLDSRAEGSPAEIVVASYNLENFVGEDTSQETAAGRHTAPKSAKAAAAVVQVVKEIAPDILGVCEMGSPEEFAVFRQALKQSGLDYPESEYVQAADPDRHVALLSRFPITARHSEVDLVFAVNGIPRHMGRGILDVTVQVNTGFELRLVGVHLKSKLAIPEGEEIVRRHEAQLVRAHVEAILTGEPQTNLLLYGDLNDTRNEPSIREIAGPRGGPAHLTDLPARDSVGDRWTQYWKVADLYSRIDYLFASPALLHSVVPGKSFVYRGEGWNEASDHRAVYTSIMSVNRR